MLTVAMSTTQHWLDTASTVADLGDLVGLAVAVITLSRVAKVARAQAEERQIMVELFRLDNIRSALDRAARFDILWNESSDTPIWPPT